MKALCAGIGQAKHYVVPAMAETVHWGYFSRLLKPVLTLQSGDFVTIETLTHHAYDDHARMIAGDPEAESVFHWTKERKSVDRRGAGPTNAAIRGRGAGEGFGVHICTGPIHVRDAEPGDVLEVRILDVKLRGCSNPFFAGRAFGSNAAAWWGFQYNDLITEPKPREVITIYEIDTTGNRNCARSLQLPLDAPDRSIRSGAPDHRLSRRAGRPCANRGKAWHLEGRPYPGATSFWGHRGGAEGG